MIEDKISARNTVIKMIKKIVYPPWISKKMAARFDNLEFCVNVDGFLYSPKCYNDKWDFQSKALWYRSVGMTPSNIAKKLNLNIGTLGNREFLGLFSLDYPGKNFKIVVPDRHDWSDQGYVDIRNDRYINHGGSPQITDDDSEIYVRVESDNELAQILYDLDEHEQLDKPKDPYKEYYGDYKD